MFITTTTTTINGQSQKTRTHYTRRIIGFGVQAGAVDGVALCRMFNRAIRGQCRLPKYLSSDHDPLYTFHQWRANLRVLGVREIKSGRISSPAVGNAETTRPLHRLNLCPRNGLGEINGDLLEADFWPGMLDQLRPTRLSSVWISRGPFGALVAAEK